ncbi:MAG: hypothetical protein ACTSQJ_08635 [Promethearchaeota archaeon]
MIFQDLINIETIDIIIIGCHLSVLFSLFLTGILFFVKSRNQDKIVQQYMNGIGLFMILYGIGRVFIFIFNISIEPFVWRLYPEQFTTKLEGDPNLLFRFQITWYFSMILSSIAVMILLIQLERYILEKKTKYILSFVQLALIILALTFGAIGGSEMTAGKIIVYLSSLPLLFIPLTYFYFAYKSSGITRKRAIGAGMGILIFFLGVAANTAAVKAIFIPYWGMNAIYFSYIMFGILIPIGLTIYLKSIKY